MSNDSATSPEAAPEPAPAPEVAPEAAEAPEAEVQDLAPEEAPETDPSEVQPEPAAPETVEIEVDGRKYLVPPDLRDGFMQHADYTQKSQKNAEFAKELAQGQEALLQQAQTHRQHLQDYGEFAHNEQLLESFRQMTPADWQALQQEDPDQHQQYWVQFQMLKDKREVIGQRIQQREYEARTHAERETANRKDQLPATLARDIPNYSPELQGKMNETAMRHGFTQAEIDTVVDPRMMRVLADAYLGEQVRQRKRAATTQPAPAPVKPVPKVGGGTTPTTGPQDKQGIEAWMRSRDQQLKRGEG